MKLIDKCRLQIQTGEPNSFILDQTELDDANIGIAGLEDFILDVNSVLDEDQLDGGSFYYQDVLNDTGSVYINRGMILASGATPYAVAGTLTATVANNQFDPFYTRQFKSGANTRFQVLYDDEWVNVFQGKLRSSVSDYDKTNKTVVTFEATDLIDDLAQTKLNAVSFPAQNTGERMQQLMQYGDHDIDQIPDTSSHNYLLAAEDITDTLLEACEDANNHELGAFYVDKFNEVVFLNYGQVRSPDIANPIFTNKVIDADNKLTMTDLEMATGKDIFFNKVVAQTLDDDDIYQLEAKTSIARHGEYTFTNTNLNFDVAGGAGSGETEVNEYMNKFLERWSDIPEKITYTDPRRFAKTVFTTNRVNDLRYPVLAEIGDQVEVDFETAEVNFVQDSMILNINHDINPDRWLSRFELMPVPNN
jgi:hypothetical protein